MSEPASGSRPAVTIPDHELIRPIGRGSYGEVWLARSTLGEYRAVKIIHRAAFDRDRPVERELEGIRKFEPISRAHENQVHILHVGRFPEGFYYVMELADDAAAAPRVESLELRVERPGGAPSDSQLSPLNYIPRTLRSEIQRRGRLPVTECLGLALKLTDALAHLHGHGLVHRDIKPSNIIFVRGQPKLADIGLVASTDASLSCVGTEGYLPPEGPGKPPADLFALGKVLYELGTGRDRADFPELPTLLRDDPEREALAEMNEVILKACEPESRRRYQSAREMHSDLVLVQSGRSARWRLRMERRVRWARKAAVIVGAFAVLAVAAFLNQQIQTREARRLAQAEAFQRTRAEGILLALQSKQTELELKQAENFFEKDEAGKGVAYLARMLRQNPSNEVAATRLMSALTDRSFALPLRVFEHTNDLLHADFNPDGQHIVTCTGDDANGEARIWDVQTGELIGRPMQHKKAVLQARFSPDGRLIATASSDGRAHIWNAFTGEPVNGPLTPPEPFSDSQTTERIKFSSDGQSLATICQTKVVVWNILTGKPSIPPIDHGSVLNDAEFGPDGLSLATAGIDLAKVWDTRSGKLRLILNHRDGLSQVRFSADGRRLLTIGSFVARLWDATRGTELLALDHEGLVKSGSFSPDGTRFVTADNNGAVRIWDAETGRLLSAPLIHGSAVRDAHFDSTGERLLTREIRRVRIWDSRTGRPLTDGLLHRGGIRSARFSPDGRSVLTASEGKTAILWDVRPGQALNLALRHPALVPSAKFSPDGQRVVTSAGGDVYLWQRETHRDEAAVWDAHTGELIARMTSSQGVQYAEFSPDGRAIVTASENGEARVWAADTGAPITKPLRHRGRVWEAKFSLDGKRVVTASEDETAQIWDAQTGQPLSEPLAHSGKVWSAEFSPDGRWVVTRTVKGARIWDAQTGQAQGTELPATGLRGSARFSPDGTRIVTTFGERSARIWDSRTGEAVTEPLNHQMAVLCANFNRNGRYVVTASEDQTARIWDARTGQPITEPLTHAGPVISAEFSPNGRRVITASADYSTRVWDVRTGQALTEPLREKHQIPYAEFSPDGRRVVAASADELARIWELPPPDLPIPGWLPDLAEAFASQRRTDQGVYEPLPPAQFLGLKSKLLAMTESDDFNRWMRWLVADREARTVSYASPATVSTYISRLLEDEELRRLSEALHLSPENGVGAARLAHRILGQHTVEHPAKNKEAEFLSQLALKLNPEEPQVWRIRGEVLEQTGRPEEALTAIERAIAFRADHPEFWTAKGRFLEQARRDEEAFQAYSRAVDLASAFALGDGEVLTSALLARAKLLKRLGREKESAKDNLRARGIGSRDPRTQSAHIDLSAHYNLSLLDDLVAPPFVPSAGKYNLASLPRVVQTLAGVSFDVRGLLRVGQPGQEPGKEVVEVRGIPVDQTCRQLHFLHAVDSFGPTIQPGKRVGNYVVAYTDGQREEIPLEINRNIGQFWSQGNGGENIEVAWRGLNRESLDEGNLVRLFKLTWPNPRPEVRIKSVDVEFAGSMNWDVAEMIYLVAITAQCEPTPTIIRQPQSQTVAEGESVEFRVEAASEAPLAYQWQLNGSDIPDATNAMVSLKGVARERAGTYTVRVRNAIENSVVTLTSEPAPLLVKSADLTHGALRREIFTNIRGTKLSDLTNHARFPDRPDTIDLVYQFEIPSNIADDYGVRLRGYLLPPRTGEYRFYVAADDLGELWLSTGDSPEHKRRIARELEWNGDRLWTAYHARPKQENISAAIHLEEGRRYYVEVLMKESAGLDSLAVAWQLPGEPPPENLSPPIPGTYLAVLNVWTKPSPGIARKLGGE